VAAGEIGLAREQEVDRQVVELTKSRDGYVDALLAIAARPARPGPRAAVLAKRYLKQRVVSIMKEVECQKRSFSALAAGWGSAAALAAHRDLPLAAALQNRRFSG
jgi:hypothetical protein